MQRRKTVAMQIPIFRELVAGANQYIFAGELHSGAFLLEPAIL